MQYGSTARRTAHQVHRRSPTSRKVDVAAALAVTHRERRRLPCVQAQDRALLAARRKRLIDSHVRGAGRRAHSQKTACGRHLPTIIAPSGFVQFESRDPASPTHSSLFLDEMGARLGSFNVTVTNVDRIATLSEMTGELFYQKHRTVMTARTTERNRQIGAALLFAQRDDEIEQIHQAHKVRLGHGGAHEELGYSGIESGQRPQVIDKVRAGQKSGIKHQIGIERQSMLIAERGQGETDSGYRSLNHECLRQEPFQVMNRQRTRINNQIGPIPKTGQHLPFCGNSCQGRLSGCEGMRTPALAESPHEDLIVRVQEHDLDGVPFGPKHLQGVEEWGQKLAPTDIDDQRNPLSCRFRLYAEPHKGGDKGGREVIDTKKTDIFQALDCLALTGPGHPGDNDNLSRFHRMTSFIVAARWLSRSRPFEDNAMLHARGSGATCPLPVDAAQPAGSIKP